MLFARTLACLAVSSAFFLQQAVAQTPPPAATAQPLDRSMQFLQEVMRTAAAVQNMVQAMSVQKTFGSAAAYPPGDPRALQRTAEIIGVGTGVGMVVGEMTHHKNGVAIGAAAGAAGGLVVDQMVRHGAFNKPR